MGKTDIGIINADWIDIPSGEFMMGSTESEEGRMDNERRHHVEVGGFKMLKTPVTFAMFDAFCEATGWRKPEDEGWGRGNRPVVNVCYWEAVDYCDWLSKQSEWSIRLPTEAEWEYACRAGTTTPFWTGHTITEIQANFSENSSEGYTTPVERFSPSLWGLHDMHGNVLEWCASEFDEGYGGMELRDTSRDRDNDSDRTQRGGCWGSEQLSLRSAKRFSCTPCGCYGGFGFRLAQ